MHSKMCINIVIVGVQIVKIQITEVWISDILYCSYISYLRLICIFLAL